MKVHTAVQPVFVSRKIAQDIKIRETKPRNVNQPRVVYSFQCACVMRVMWAMRADTYTHVGGGGGGWTKGIFSINTKHYHEQLGEVRKEQLRRFSILKKCRNKFDCLVNELLFIRDLKPTLNVQSDSIPAIVCLASNPIS